MTSAGWTLLVAAIAKNPALSTLRLWADRVLACVVYEALRLNQLPSVTCFDATNCDIRDVECIVLHDMLISNRTLTRLLISHSEGPLTNAGCDHIIRALHSNTTIVDVELGGNKVTPDKRFELECLLDNRRQSSIVQLQTPDSQRARLLDMYMSAMQSPDQITPAYISEMLPLIHTLEEFRFPYTLACTYQRDALKNTGIVGIVISSYGAPGR